MSDVAKELNRRIDAVKRYLKAHRICVNELATAQHGLDHRSAEGADRRIVAKYKEAVQLWEHGLKEAKQKLEWGVEDLEKYANHHSDHSLFSEGVKKATRDLVAKGRATLKGRIEHTTLPDKLL